jgi:hypothetical protein
MGDIDEVSKALGALQASFEEARVSRHEIAQKLIAISTRIGEMDSKLTVVCQSVQLHEGRLKYLESETDIMKGLRNRGIGLIAGVGLLGGGVGSLVTWFAHGGPTKLWGGD